MKNRALVYVAHRARDFYLSGRAAATMWFYLISGAVYGFAAGAQPGPFTAYMVSLTLKQGFRRSLPAVFAPLVSDAFIVAVTLLVLTSVPASLVRWLQIIGGGFVLYLAWGAWKSWRDYRPEITASEQSVKQSVLKATLVNLLNPNPYLSWSLVLGPLVLNAWRESHKSAAVVALGFYGALFGTTIAILLLFDFAKNRGPQVARALIGLSAIALACFGIYQLWQGLALHINA